MARPVDDRAGQHSTVRAVDVSGFDHEIVGLLAPSLAIFQLGESGTGEHLFEAARHAVTDPGYRRCLERFVTEEQEHSRLLGVVLDAMGQPFRHHHWTDRAFVLIRRAHSLRTEVLALMVAEVVALSYYGALAAKVRSPVYGTSSAASMPTRSPTSPSTPRRCPSSFSDSPDPSTPWPDWPGQGSSSAQRWSSSRTTAAS